MRNDEWDDSSDQNSVQSDMEEFYEEVVFSTTFNEYLFWFQTLTWSSIYYSCKQKLVWFLDSATCSFSVDDIMMMMTLFVLFSDEIKILAVSPSADGIDFSFEVTNTVCMFTFIAEFLANSWSKTEFISILNCQIEGYLFSFFWFCDIIAILSMFIDIHWIAVGIGLGNLSNTVGGGSHYTKAGRVVRLVRLVRLIRLYKIASERRRRLRIERDLMELVEAGEMEITEVEQQKLLHTTRHSKLGSQLSATIIRHVIILVLIMLIVLPTLTYTAVDNSPQFGLQLLQEAMMNPSLTNTSKTILVDDFIDVMVHKNSYRVLAMLKVEPFIDGYAIYNQNLLNSVRHGATIDLSLSSLASNNSTVTTSAIFDLNPLLQQMAFYSIMLTIFVSVMLVMGSVVFTSDAQRLVLDPINRMMNMVEAVANNPLTALTEMMRMDEHLTGVSGDKNRIGYYELKLLETTIAKITGFLRVGFGEAGAGIISANLNIKDKSFFINPLLPGVRVYAIFGFCDIHHFEQITEVLAKDVLKFVNTVAEIVHTKVHNWGGQCNKNLGNAFVIVWRIGDEKSLSSANEVAIMHNRAMATGGGGFHSTASTHDTASVSSSSTGPGDVDGSILGSSGGENLMLKPAKEREREARETRKKKIDLRRVPGVDVLADNALIGYLKVIVEINRSASVLKYRRDPRLTKNYTQDFKVRMGFGLHAGWAIEGAVGSLYKVDATYLSPHVNMAARLETSSRQYGVPLLASHSFYELMSEAGQGKMRRLDVVTVKGSEVPMGIYTYDCLQDRLFAAPLEAGFGHHSSARMSILQRIVNKRVSAVGVGGLNSGPRSALSDPLDLNTGSQREPRFQKRMSLANLTVLFNQSSSSGKGKDGGNNDSSSHSTGSTKYAPLPPTSSPEDEDDVDDTRQIAMNKSRLAHPHSHSPLRSGSRQSHSNSHHHPQTHHSTLGKLPTLASLHKFPLYSTFGPSPSHSAKEKDSILGSPLDPALSHSSILSFSSSSISAHHPHHSHLLPVTTSLPFNREHSSSVSHSPPHSSSTSSSSTSQTLIKQQIQQKQQQQHQQQGQGQTPQHQQQHQQQSPRSSSLLHPQTLDELEEIHEKRIRQEQVEREREGEREREREQHSSSSSQSTSSPPSHSYQPIQQEIREEEDDDDDDIEKEEEKKIEEKEKEYEEEEEQSKGTDLDTESVSGSEKKTRQLSTSSFFSTSSSSSKKHQQQIGERRGERRGEEEFRLKNAEDFYSPVSFPSDSIESSSPSNDPTSLSSLSTSKSTSTVPPPPTTTTTTTLETTSTSSSSPPSTSSSSSSSSTFKPFSSSSNSLAFSLFPPIPPSDESSSSSSTSSSSSSSSSSSPIESEPNKNNPNLKQQSSHPHSSPPSPNSPSSPSSSSSTLKSTPSSSSSSSSSALLPWMMRQRVRHSISRTSLEAEDLLREAGILGEKLLVERAKEQEREKVKQNQSVPKSLDCLVDTGGVGTNTITIDTMTAESTSSSIIEIKPKRRKSFVPLDLKKKHIGETEDKNNQKKNDDNISSSNSNSNIISNQEKGGDDDGHKYHIELSTINNNNNHNNNNNNHNNDDDKGGERKNNNEDEGEYEEEEDGEVERVPLKKKSLLLPSASEDPDLLLLDPSVGLDPASLRSLQISDVESLLRVASQGSLVALEAADKAKSKSRIYELIRLEERILQEPRFLSIHDDTSDVFEQDADLLLLRLHVPQEFTEIFSEGVNSYLQGDWSSAKNLLERANQLMRESLPNIEGDGPCLTLLSYMRERNWASPSDWKGCRPLTSK